MSSETKSVRPIDFTTITCIDGSTKGFNLKYSSSYFDELKSSNFEANFQF